MLAFRAIWGSGAAQNDSLRISATPRTYFQEYHSSYCHIKVRECFAFEGIFRTNDDIWEYMPVFDLIQALHIVCTYEYVRIQILTNLIKHDMKNRYTWKRLRLKKSKMCVFGVGGQVYYTTTPVHLMSSQSARRQWADARSGSGWQYHITPPKR